MRIPAIAAASRAGKSTGTPGGWLPEITANPPGLPAARSRVKTRPGFRHRQALPGFARPGDAQKGYAIGTQQLCQPVTRQPAQRH